MSFLKTGSIACPEALLLDSSTFDLDFQEIITTNTSGMTEILGENNEFGLIVENNEEALYNGLKELIQNKNLLNEYKQKVKNRSTFFSTQKTVKEVEMLLDNI